MRRRALTFVFLLGAAPADELILQPGMEVPASVEGNAVRLRVDSSGLNRLTLSQATVDRLGLKPATLFGKATLTLAGRKERTGYNRPVRFTVDGREAKARAFWLRDAELGEAEAVIGPIGVPQARVTFLLPGPSEGATTERYPLLGTVDTGTLTSVKLNGRPVAIAFEVTGGRRLPLVSAAAGALLASALDGHVSGASWDEPILLGITRPVRLLKLAQPLVFGPFRFSELAVRVPDRVDAAGRGPAIREAGEDDPAEVTVSASAKGRPPVYSLLIPASALRACARLSFDKPARTIELSCQDAALPAGK